MKVLDFHFIIFLLLEGGSYYFWQHGRICHFISHIYFEWYLKWQCNPEQEVRFTIRYFYIV